MSGIYIKGMKMPDRCFACPMCDTDCCGVSKGSYIEYREVDVDTAIDHRPDWCPLIPVPDHGRLIDADVVFKRLQKQAMSVWGNGNPRYQLILEVMDAIRFAPTVIPASRGKENE